jgi:hypothetical protein
MAPALAPQRMEVRRAIVAGDHRLAIDQERRCLDAEGSIDDGRETIGPVMAVAGEAADAGAILAHRQAVAVMLDFVDPQRARRRPRHLRRLARFDEAGGMPRYHCWSNFFGRHKAERTFSRLAWRRLRACF